MKIGSKKQQDSKIASSVWSMLWKGCYKESIESTFSVKSSLACPPRLQIRLYNVNTQISFQTSSHFLQFQRLKILNVFLSGVPRPEVVCVCVCRGWVVKPLVYRQWKFRHVTLVKWVKTTASIWTTHSRSFDKMENVLSENFRGDNSTIIS